jgi:hypothetical protein
MVLLLQFEDKNWVKLAQRMARSFAALGEYLCHFLGDAILFCDVQVAHHPPAHSLH